MNDRFKLRAWDGKKMLTHNVTELKRYMLDFGGNFGIMDLQNMLWSGLYSGVILMQCTGLKDDEGTLIMESDIVEAWDTRRGDDEKVWVRVKVHYLNGCFMFGNWSAHEFMNRFRGRKVIGNRYSNPELMEGNND